MKKVEHDLLTSKYTEVWYEEESEMQFNAPHHFTVYGRMEDVLDEAGEPVRRPLGKVRFQCGPIKENGVNGVANEDLIAMVITRLEHFNQSEFRCRENSMAITKLEEALLWLRKRTIGREKRGVEGTNIV